MERKLALASRASRGFTLVEIMVVVVILGLLATLVTTNAISANEEANLKKAKVDVSQLKGAVDTFIIRSSAVELPTWDILITPDQGGTVWLPGFSRAPMDPWGNEYEMRPGEHGLKDYETRSWGPDGVPDTADDISSDTIKDR